jgi:hypothetical protein
VADERAATAAACVLHPEAEARLADFKKRGIPLQRPVHAPGECPACDAWRLQSKEAESNG